MTSVIIVREFPFTFDIKKEEPKKDDEKCRKTKESLLEGES